MGEGPQHVLWFPTFGDMKRHGLAGWRGPGRVSPRSLVWDIWRATRGQRSAIEKRQRRRLAALVAWARSRSPYYAELYRNVAVEQVTLSQLPPVSKRELMARFDDWVTDPVVTRTSVERFIADPARIGDLYLGRYVVWHTSGSTGVPVVLLQDRGAMGVFAALDAARATPTWFSWRDMATLWRHGGAAIIATGGHYTAAVKIERRRRTRPWRRGRMRVLDAATSLPELVRELNTLRPALVGAYATTLTLLAYEQEAGRLRIDPILVHSSGETLAADTRARIEAAFHCRVRETYSAAEAIALAYTCEHGWFHVNEDWVIVEPVDRSYQPTPPGQRSHSVLITNLANRVQPILRYDLNDRALVKPEPCPCGSLLLALHIEGRTDEILSFPNPEGEAIHLLPMALYIVGRTTPGVQRHQLIQTGRERLTVRLEAEAGTDHGAVWNALRERLRAYLAGRGLPDVLVALDPEPPESDSRNGKFRRVWSNLDS